MSDNLPELNFATADLLVDAHRVPKRLRRMSKRKLKRHLAKRLNDVWDNATIVLQSEYRPVDGKPHTFKLEFTND
jgi:hypothetical protein